MNGCMDEYFAFLNRASWYIYVRRTNKMHPLH